MPAKGTVVVTHAYLVNGKIHEVPTSTLIETLNSKSISFVFVRHSIDGQFPSIVYDYEKKEIIRERQLFTLSKIPTLRYLTEISSTFFYFLRRKPHSVYIGVDPLNAFSGILLKKIGRFKKVIFYTADYAKKRFNNPILNKAYHLIDKFCVKNADAVWNVSSRIVEVRKQIGLADDKNILVPNVPSGDYLEYINNERNPYHLVTLGVIGDQLDFKGIIDAVSGLRDKYPTLILKIIGSGPKEQEYKDYVNKRGLDKQVRFLGFLDHNKALEEISKSGIGLALYNGNWDFNYFGDSMKCREFFCFGLPVISTDTHSTVEEIKAFEAGVVCDVIKAAYKKALLEILDNYEKYSKNSYELAAKYKNIHSELIGAL